jgi:hypothetical protein
LVEPFGTVPLVLDTSAWVRQRDPAIRPRWEATLQAGLISASSVTSTQRAVIGQTATDKCSRRKRTNSFVQGRDKCS